MFSNVGKAKFYIDEHGLPVVIKVDGLAGGKGVKVCQTKNDAYLFLNEIEGGKFGAAGDKFIIEECLKGETQPILVRMKSDLLAIILMALEGKLDSVQIEWDKRPALCVVMASNGYPESYIKGFPISGIHDAEKIGAIVFHAGTIKDNEGNIVTDGGRVLGVTALGNSLKEARETAYAAVKKISWKGCFYRKDIGCRAINRK